MLPFLYKNKAKVSLSLSAASDTHCTPTISHYFQHKIHLVDNFKTLV